MQPQRQPTLKLDKRTRKGKRISAETQAAARSVTHIADTVGGYDLPHAMTHAKAAIKSKDPAVIRYEVQHVVRHINDAQKYANKMAHKIQLLPGIRKEQVALDKERNRSYK